VGIGGILGVEQEQRGICPFRKTQISNRFG
jgi:hypothetical protein